MGTDILNGTFHCKFFRKRNKFFWKTNLGLLEMYPTNTDFRSFHRARSSPFIDFSATSFLLASQKEIQFTFHVLCRYKTPWCHMDSAHRSLTHETHLRVLWWLTGNHQSQCLHNILYCRDDRRKEGVSTCSLPPRSGSRVQVKKNI